MKIFAFVVFCCVALLPSIILGDKSPGDKLRDRLDEMARTNKIINNIFKPSKNGYLGMGFTSIAYKGTLRSTNKEVAMKFSFENFEVCAAHEYEMYTCLDAINNTGVEAYGIPSVHYYGPWENYNLIALTLLDTNVNNLIKNHRLTATDILIALRDYVRATKYIHNHGIYHNALYLNNVMFRNNQLFVIDFMSAQKLYAPSESCVGISGTQNDYGTFHPNLRALAQDQKILSRELRQVFNSIDSLAVRESKPDYNRIYQIINEEIKRINRKRPANFSWLTDQPLNLYQIPTIESIAEPTDAVEYRYPTANFTYFDSRGKKLPSSFQAGSSSRCGKGFDLNELPQSDSD